MEDFSDDDINYFIAKLSEDCSKSFFDNFQNGSQLIGIKLDEQLIKQIREKEETMRTMCDLLNYVFNKQQKILADYEELKIQGEHSLLVSKQEIQQYQYQIEQLQTLNEENQDKNQQFLDQIEELENLLQQKKSEIIQMKQNEGRINQNHQVHEIKSQEQKEQLQSLQNKVHQLEEINSKFKSEAIASQNLQRQYEMRQKDYEDKIEILELQLKNNLREKEKLSKQNEELFKKQQSEIITSTQISINTNFSHNSPQKSTRKNSTYSSNNNNHETIQKLRRQSGFLNQPKLEQIQKQINNIPESESESENENQSNRGKTLKQEKNEKKNIQKELNNLKTKILELEKQKGDLETELTQNKEKIAIQEGKIRQYETNQKKMNLKSNQLEKKVANLTEEKNALEESHKQERQQDQDQLKKQSEEFLTKIKFLQNENQQYALQLKELNQYKNKYHELCLKNLKEEDEMDVLLRNHESAVTAHKQMQKQCDQQLYQINLNQILNISDADLIFTRQRSNASVFKKKDVPIEQTEIFKKKLKESLEQNLRSILMSEQNNSDILQRALNKIDEYEKLMKKIQEENQKLKFETDEQKKKIDLLNFKNKELEIQNDKDKLEMIEHQKILDQYKVKLFRSEDQLNLQQEKIKVLQETVDQQYQDVKNLNEKMIQQSKLMDDQVKISKQEIDRLNDRNDNKQLKLDQALIEIQHLTTDYKMAKIKSDNDIKNLTEKNNKLEIQLDGILKQQEQKELEFNSINDINTKMEQTLQALMKNYSDIDTKYIQLEIVKKQLEEQNNDLSEKIKKQREKKKILKKEIVIKEQNYIKIQTELSIEQQKCLMQQNKIQSMQDNIEQIKNVNLQMYTSIEQDRNQKIEESNQLKTVISELEINKTDLSRQKENLDKEIEEIKLQFTKQNEMNEQKIHFLEEETKKKDDESEKLRFELEVIKKEKEHQVASLNEELSESEKKLLKIQNEFLSLQEQFNQLQLSMNASKSEAHLLYQDLLKEQHIKEKTYKNELNTLQSQISNYNLQIEQCTNTIQQLNSNIQVLTITSNQYNHQLTQSYIQEQLQIILLQSIITNISFQADEYKRKSEIQYLEAQSTIQQLHTNLKSQTNHCQLLEKSNNEMDKEIIRLQNLLADDVHIIQQLKNQLLSKESQLNQIQLQYQEFENQQNKSLQDLQDLKILFVQIQKEKVDLENHLAEQFQIVKEAHKQIDIFSKELAESKLEIQVKEQNQVLQTENFKQQNSELSEKNLFLQELTKTFEETILRKDEEIEDMNKNCQELRQILTLKAYEIESLEQDIKQAKADLVSNQQKLFDEQSQKTTQETQFKIQLENYIKSQQRNSEVIDFSENKFELLEKIQGQKLEFDVNIQTQNEKLRLCELQVLELRNEQFQYLEKINELSQIINSDSICKERQKNFIQEILVLLIKQSDGLKKVNEQETENLNQVDSDDIDKLKMSTMMQINIINSQIELMINNLKEIQLNLMSSNEQIKKLEQQLKESQENETKNKLLIESLLLNNYDLNEKIEQYQKSSSQQQEIDLLKKDQQNKINRIQESLNRKEQDLVALNEQYKLMLQDQINKTDELNNLRKKYDDLMSDIDRMTPTRSPSNSISQKTNQIDQYQQYFNLTAQAVALSSDDPLAAAEIKLKNFYQEAKNRNISFHQWHNWLQLKLKEELSKNKKR